jgi:hypothetical protein
LGRFSNSLGRIAVSLNSKTEELERFGILEIFVYDAGKDVALIWSQIEFLNLSFIG